MTDVFCKEPVAEAIVVKNINLPSILYIDGRAIGVVTNLNFFPIVGLDKFYTKIKQTHKKHYKARQKYLKKRGAR